MRASQPGGAVVFLVASEYSCRVGKQAGGHLCASGPLRTPATDTELECLMNIIVRAGARGMLRVFTTRERA